MIAAVRPRGGRRFARPRMRPRSAKGPAKQGWGPGQLCWTGRGGTPRSIAKALDRVEWRMPVAADIADRFEL